MEVELGEGKEDMENTANQDTGLKPLNIDAFSFDEALEIARKIDSRYNSGSVHSYKYSYCY